MDDLGRPPLGRSGLIEMLLSCLIPESSAGIEEGF